MALLDIFKKKDEKKRFERKQKEKAKPRPVVQDSEKKDSLKPAEKKAAKEQKPKDSKKLSEFSAKVLANAHVTEKSTILGERGAYVFKIRNKANKPMVRQAIKETFGVNPLKIGITKAPSKKRFVRGKRGKKAGFKKAVVYLKKGEKIEV